MKRIILFGSIAFLLTLYIAFFIMKDNNEIRFTDGVDLYTTTNDKNEIVNEHLSKQISESIETFNGISVVSLKIETEVAVEDSRSAILSIQTDGISDEEISKIIKYLHKGIPNLSEDSITILDDNQNQLYPSI